MAKKRRAKATKSNRKHARTTGELVDGPSARVSAAQKIMREGRRADAFDLFQEAIRQEPNNVRTYVMAARAQAQAFRFDRMEAIHQKLIDRAPRHPGVYHYIGETFGLLKLPTRARECFEKAASLPGAGPPTWMELASYFEQSHRLEEARELIDRAVQSGYKPPLAGLIRAKILRRLGELGKAEAALLALTGSLPQDNQWVCQAWGELALMKDRQGDYEGAIAAIENCKGIQREREAAYLEASARHEALIGATIDNLAKDDIVRWRDAAGSLPAMRVAMLTGFPRSGTTLLEQLLDAHPDLVSSEERDYLGKELFHAISARQGAKPLLDILNSVTPQQVAAQRDAYLPAMEYLLGERVDGRMHLDKNPAYNLLIPLLLRFFPEMRLVIALRDPRDVVLSCYLRYLPLNTVSVRFLSLEQTAERYAFDMRTWLRLREMIDTPWCEVRYEDTVDDLGRQARRAFDTLGLPWREEVLNYRERLGKERQVTSPTYEAVAAPVHKGAIGRWRNYEQYLAPVFEKLAPFVREFGYE